MDGQSQFSNHRRPRFGNRTLNEQVDVFAHNAWDNVEWDEEQRQIAEEKVKLNSSAKVESDRALELEQKAHQYWNTFYETHQDKFFKDRKWLFIEFPELLANCPDVKQQIAISVSRDPHKHYDDDPKSGQHLNCQCVAQDSQDVKVQSDSMLDDIAGEKLQIWENGCGVGNTIMSILKHNNCPNTIVYGSDFSDVAIDVLKQRCANDDRCKPFVFDATADPEQMQMPFEPNSLDIVIMIFALSAISPDKMQRCIDNVVPYLRPGGVFMFRDYCRYDLAQLRFKTGRCLGDNFYVRGDGTRAYFFTEQEVHLILTQSGLVKKSLYVDKRLLVNRFKKMKMYRVWLQAKYIKPVADSD